jgi:hypothetical protein
MANWGGKVEVILDSEVHSGGLYLLHQILKRRKGNNKSPSGNCLIEYQTIGMEKDRWRVEKDGELGREGRSDLG